MTTTGNPETLVLTRRDLARLMKPADYLAAAEAACRALKDPESICPPPWHVAGDTGAFHGKGATLRFRGGHYMALKLNGNFPLNPAKNALPTIQGAVLLCDATDGRLLAILDSIEITLRRTAAASAIAAKHLAKPDSRSLLLCGCGLQGAAHLDLFTGLFPLERLLLWDRDRAAAERLKQRCGVTAEILDDLPPHPIDADIIITCTSATAPFLMTHHAMPGVFIAAVGTDSPNKSEIDPYLMAKATIVTDSTGQCIAMGDLRAAIAMDVLTPADIHGDIGDIVTGRVDGRRNSEEIFLFDSNGFAFLDVASAVLACHNAREAGAGLAIDLGGL